MTAGIEGSEDGCGQPVCFRPPSHRQPRQSQKDIPDPMQTIRTSTKPSKFRDVLDLILGVIISGLIVEFDHHARCISNDLSLMARLNLVDVTWTECGLASILMLNQ